MLGEAHQGLFSGMLPNKLITKPDGARWRQFDIEGGAIVLTSKGLELFRDTPAQQLVSDIRDYRKAVAENDLDSGARQYLANGGNGTVYSVGGHEVVVKESYSPQSLYFALERMDHLSQVVQTHLPHWVEVVDHYGLLTSRKLDREYMLMQKIDNGVSLEDLVQVAETGEARFPVLTTTVNELFPGLGQTEIDEIKGQLREMKDAVVRYCESEQGKEAEDTLKSLLPDPNYANILVTPLKTPIGGKRYKLWLIDQ